MAGKILISFKTSDTPRVQPIYDGLRAEGFDVFWSNDIPTGSLNYQAIIKSKLLEADAVVVVWTNESVHSGPVAQECAQAEKQNKLFQILLDDIEPIDLPMEVRYKAQKTKLFGWTGDRCQENWLKLVSAIKARANPQGASEGPSLKVEDRRQLAASLDEVSTTASVRSEPARSGSWRTFGLAAGLLAVVAAAIALAWQLGREFYPDRAALPKSSSAANETTAPSANNEAAPSKKISQSDANLAGKSSEVEKSKLTPGKTFRDCPDVCPEMVVVPAGEFTMGTTSNEMATLSERISYFPHEYLKREQPDHRVNISKPFAAGATHITRRQFAVFAKATGFAAGQCAVYDGGKWAKSLNANWLTPGFDQSDDHPAVCVSWDDALRYTEWLSSVSGKKYRLLREVEAEFIARAVLTPIARSDFSFGNDPSVLCSHGNAADLSGAERFGWKKDAVINCWDGFAFTSPAGQFVANAFGIKDAHGNVWSWTQDCLGSYEASAPANCGSKIIRGGSWADDWVALRSAYRNWAEQTARDGSLGFRVARDLD